MEPYTFNPEIVPNKNVRNFEVMMDDIQIAKDEGMFCCVFGRAGRGKSRTVKWYHSHHDTIYLRMMSAWKKTDIEFLKDFSRELGVMNPPHRRGPCFREIIDRLMADPRPIFLDEIEKMPNDVLEICRDITDVTTAPIILVGEEELFSYMNNNRRVWSRTFQKLEFMPIETADVMLYAKNAAGMMLAPEGAALILSRAEGDLRLVKRTLLNLIRIANSKGGDTVTMEMIKVAIKRGLVGK
jgi:hypothetical protein